MPIERLFLGWDKPLLFSAADALVQRFMQPSVLDLSHVTIVAQVNRAARRLLEILVERAERNDCVLVPPQMVSVGALPEYLIHEVKPSPASLVTRLAWLDALRGVSKKTAALLFPQAPDGHDYVSWLQLAQQVERLYEELAGANLEFSSVLECLAALGSEHEVLRWQALGEAYQKYLESLAKLGVRDRHQSRAAVLREGSLDVDKTIVLIAASDLNAVAKSLLSLAAKKGEVISMVFAPLAEADGFDEFGCIKATAWARRMISVSDASLRVAFGPQEQAHAVAAGLCALKGSYSAEEITIGIADTELAPFVVEHLRERAVPVRYAAGQKLSNSGPYLLLRSVEQFLRQGRFRDVGSLLRHVDLRRLWEAAVGPEVISAFDGYQSKHLQARFDLKTNRNPDLGPELLTLRDSLSALLSGVMGDKRPLTQWCSGVAELLVAVYGTAPLRRSNPEDRLLIESCEAIHQVLNEMQSFNSDALGPLDSVAALGMLSSELGERSIAAQPVERAVELLGWLELSLDDAPALIVAGCNEGNIPEAVNADPFLPNRLRQTLGLLDNERRYARDCYALTTLLHSRDSLTLIAGRYDAAAQPLALSRLLLADSAASSAKRVIQFFSEGGNRAVVPADPSNALGEQAWTATKPPALKHPIECMSVTSFKDYLRCPYRFYLQYVQGLRRVDDLAAEMSPIVFGNVLHEVLRKFGTSEIANSSNREEIEEFLVETLRFQIRHEFGELCLAAVRVQAHQAEKRFRAFSKRQAAWRAAGWEIRNVEEAISEKDFWLSLDDGARMGVRGRIDRIDYNEAQKRWLVLDYKSSDRAETPESSHQKSGRWINLQLPLYLCFAKTCKGLPSVGCGLVNISMDRDEESFCLAKWGEEDLESAVEAAKNVAAAVRQGEFWPPGDVPAERDGFAPVCRFINAAGEGGK